MPALSRRLLLPAYLTMVIGGGAAILGLSLYGLDSESALGERPILFVTFAVLLVAAESRPLTFLVNGGAATASWTFAFALLFVAPTGTVLALVAATALMVDLLGGKRIERAAFNAGQFVISLAIAMAVAGAITNLRVDQSGMKVDLHWLLAAATASAVAFLFNSAFIGAVIAIHQRVSAVEMLRRSLSVNLLMDGLLLALAPIFAVIGVNAFVLLPLLLTTVWIIYRSASIAMSNRHEATHDSLTEIPNRRLFEEHGAMVLEGALAKNFSAAALQLDLDGFKGVNDRLGHRIGDLVLREIATRIRNERRPRDHVSRLGGDEFAILLGDVSTATDAEAAARRILNAIERPMTIEGLPLAISASIGISMFPAHGSDLRELMNHADVAMYSAKRAGTDIEVYEPAATTHDVGRLAMVSDLARGIAAGELVLHYQPKLDVQSGEIVGVEGLVRWNHPVLGTVLPNRFMPQAEQTDLMTPFTDKVIDMALEQCARWHAEGIHLTVAVNASARNLHDMRFPDRVDAALKRHALDPGWLEIEITENTVMEDLTRSVAVLRQLRAIGVRLAIDDFGTGYSSLVALRDLTIDTIKIDRSFVTSLADNPGDLTIVRSVIELGHNLGLRTVAEGVETVDALEIITALGCDEYQGFLASVPMTAEELQPLLSPRVATTP